MDIRQFPTQRWAAPIEMWLAMKRGDFVLNTSGTIPTTLGAIQVTKLLGLSLTGGTTGNPLLSGGTGAPTWGGGMTGVTTLAMSGILTNTSVANATTGDGLSGAFRTLGGLSVKIDTWIGGILNVAGASTLTGVVTGGTYNSQTITSAANFTGSLTLAGVFTSNQTGDINQFIVASSITMTRTNSNIIPGASAFNVTNNANTQINLAILDNGNTTIRGTLTAGTYNGQTITSAASFTGTLTVAGKVSFTNTSDPDSVTFAGSITMTRANSNIIMGGSAFNLVNSTNTSIWMSLTNAAGIANFNGTTDATSISTGTLITAGGLGVAKAAWIGGLMNVAGKVTFANSSDPDSVTFAGSITMTRANSNIIIGATAFNLINAGNTAVIFSITPGTPGANNTNLSLTQGAGAALSAIKYVNVTAIGDLTGKNVLYF